MEITRYAVLNSGGIVCLIFDTMAQANHAILSGALSPFGADKYTVSLITGHKGVIS